jgi:hypothetical protein
MTSLNINHSYEEYLEECKPSKQKQRVGNGIQEIFSNDSGAKKQFHV